MVSSIFTECAVIPSIQFWNTLITPESPVPISRCTYSPQPLATMNLLCVSMDLPILDISRLDSFLLPYLWILGKGGLVFSLFVLSKHCRASFPPSPKARSPASSLAQEWAVRGPGCRTVRGPWGPLQRYPRQHLTFQVSPGTPAGRRLCSAFQDRLLWRSPYVLGILASIHLS